MNIKVKVKKTFDNSKRKAICDVTIDDKIVIHGVGLIESDKGTFISMPSEKWKNKAGETKHSDIVHAITAEARAELFNAVKEAYASLSDPTVSDSEFPFNI